MMVGNKFRSFVISEQVGVPNTGELCFMVSILIASSLVAKQPGVLLLN